MHEGMQMKRFSEAYLCAVAAAANIKAQEDTSPDDDSVDWMLKAGPDVYPNRPQLDVQLKCCKQPITGNTTVNYRLKLKNYDDLRTTNLSVPRILVVVLVPPTPPEWLEHTEDRILLRRCGYWVSLRGFPPLPAGQTRKTVNIPRAQQFTTVQLLDILGRIDVDQLP